MTDISNYLFGPLDKSVFCNFFLVLTIFGFILLVGAFIIMLYGLSNQIGMVYYIKSFMIMLFYFVFYLQSRILYSMCSGTIGSP